MAGCWPSLQPATDFALCFYDIGLPEQKSKENVQQRLFPSNYHSMWSSENGAGFKKNALLAAT
jgi:hypothetical protein